MVCFKNFSFRIRNRSWDEHIRSFLELHNISYPAYIMIDFVWENYVLIVEPWIQLAKPQGNFQNKLTTLLRPIQSASLSYSLEALLLI